MPSLTVKSLDIKINRLLNVVPPRFTDAVSLIETLNLVKDFERYIILSNLDID